MELMVVKYGLVIASHKLKMGFLHPVVSLQCLMNFTSSLQNTPALLEMPNRSD